MTDERLNEFTAPATRVSDRCGHNFPLSICPYEECGPKDLLAEVKRLRLALEAARKDTARLDWLEKSEGEISTENIEDPDDEDSEILKGFSVYGAIASEKNASGRQVVSSTSTALRIAIDAAMKDKL